MQSMLPLAEKIAAMLKDRRENIAVAESTTGGLISAALLSVPGASAYFIGGAVVYTLKARRAMLEVPDSAFAGIKSVTEEGAMILARAARTRFAVTWSIAEIGASGPTGNRYGDAAGHSCIAVAGPVERALTVETGSPDRLANMRTFSAAALNLLIQSMDVAV
ncbi:MAG TPA: CinA family protein [Candidatus Binatus sp.]|uniref:CinA family protein n=1 Tax=Candidatus Binatus sp. TaxID=2811406 RepID=UPI002B470EEC|nr:CinA family protein [Candidatus Binatus sp.]HKN11776.1 CinA family protein [Candidatus Binatus sp.]